MAKIQDVITSQLNFQEQTTTPSTPEEGVIKIYPLDDGKMYKLDSDGVETEIGSGSGGGTNFTETTEDMYLFVGYEEALTGIIVSTAGAGVTGTETLFTSELTVGDCIHITDGDNDEVGMIDIITDDENLTLVDSLQYSYSGATVTAYRTGNDSNDGSAPDSAHALATIQAAIDKVPALIKHEVVVIISPGDYGTEDLTISDKIVWGQGTFVVAPSIQTNPIYTIVKSITILRVLGHHGLTSSIYGLTFSSIAVMDTVVIRNSSSVFLTDVYSSDYFNGAGIKVVSSAVAIVYCMLDNHKDGLHAEDFSRVFIMFCSSPNGNSRYGINSTSGSVVVDMGENTLTGSTANNHIESGGMIYPYVVLPTLDQSAQPSNTDIPSGGSVMWTDTDDSKCYLCYNHGGTVKKVELT
jgi:hypothetical protein